MKDTSRQSLRTRGALERAFETIAPANQYQYLHTLKHGRNCLSEKLDLWIAGVMKNSVVQRFTNDTHEGR